MSSQGNPLHDGRLFIPQLPYGASGNVHTYDNYNMHKDLLVHGNAHVMTDLAVDRNVYIAGNLHVAGNMTEVTLNNTITDDLIITVGGNNINNTNYRGVEMGYATGNAFFGYNPNSTLFELYEDIGESIPSDNNFDGNVTTKGTLQCEIHGNVTGNLTGDIVGNTTVTGNIRVNGNSVVDSTSRVYNNLYLHDNIVFQDGSNGIYGAGTEDVIQVYGNTLFRSGGFGCIVDQTLTNHPTSINGSKPDGYFYRLDGQFHLKIDDNFYICGENTSGNSQAGSFRFLIDGNNNGHFYTYDIHSSFNGSFTGIHDINESYDEYGLILESTGVVDKTDNLNTIVETQLCSTNKSKKVYGVSLNGNTNGVVSLGEATMLVTNYGGNIMNGDYICSSEISGYGMLQDDDILHSYTVAKSTEDIDWDNVTDTIEHNGQTYKKVLIAVTLHCG